LFEAGLVKKESGSYYFLTTFGESVLLQLSSLKFLSENKGYFSDHTFGELPLKFIQRIERIGALYNSQFLGSSVAIFKCIRVLFDLSHRYIYAILSEITIYFLESASQVIKRGVAVKYLIPHNAVSPKKRHSESEHQNSKNY
jgi:predicted transcriptional regulator